MNSGSTIYKTLSMAFNAIAIIVIMLMIRKTNSDKSLLVFLVYYPLLFLFNLVVYFYLSMLKSSFLKVQRQILTWIVLLLVPLIIVAINF